jgi:hypothetical protein
MRKVYDLILRIPMAADYNFFNYFISFSFVRLRLSWDEEVFLEANSRFLPIFLVT